MQSELERLFTEVRDALAWAPDWITGVLLVAFAALVAVAAHVALLAVLRRAVPPSRVFLRSLIERTRGPVSTREGNEPESGAALRTRVGDGAPVLCTPLQHGIRVCELCKRLFVQHFHRLDGAPSGWVEFAATRR